MRTADGSMADDDGQGSELGGLPFGPGRHVARVDGFLAFTQGEAQHHAPHDEAHGTVVDGLRSWGRQLCCPNLTPGVLVRCVSFLPWTSPSLVDGHWSGLVDSTLMTR